MTFNESNGDGFANQPTFDGGWAASLNRSVPFPKVMGAVERRLTDRTLYLRNQESTVLRRTLLPLQNPRT